MQTLDQQQLATDSESDVRAACTDSSQNPPPAAAMTGTNGHAAHPPQSATAIGGKSRGGAPRHNSNASKGGLRGSKLPPGCRGEANHIQGFCRRVKAEYEGKHGPMTAHAESILHRLRRAATKDRLAARWLRMEAATLTIEQRLQLTDAMAAASDTIEKCLRLLKLDAEHSTADPMAALRDLVASQTPPSTTPGETP
jgi:hypothetical protein